MTKERDIRLDIIRGIAVYAVTVGHVGNSYLSDFIYSFQMGLFFFISGYVINMNMQEKSNDYLKKYLLMLYKKSFLLLVPYTVWMFLCKLATCISDGHLWFLPVLYMVFAMYTIWNIGTLLLKINPQNLTVRLILLLLLQGFLTISAWKISWTPLTNTVIWSFPFFIGVLLNQYNEVKKLIENKYFIGAMIILYCICFPRYSLLRYDTSHLWEMHFIRELCNISMIVIIWNVINKYRLPMYLNKILRKFGENSMEIYLLGTFLLDVMPIGVVLGDKVGYLGVLFYSLMICFFSIVVGNIVQLSPITSFLLLGKKGYIK